MIYSLIYFKMVRKMALHKRQLLRQDILDRYDNGEYWDGDLFGGVF